MEGSLWELVDAARTEVDVVKLEDIRKATVHQKTQVEEDSDSVRMPFTNVVAVKNSVPDLHF